MRLRVCSRSSSRFGFGLSRPAWCIISIYKTLVGLLTGRIEVLYVYTSSMLCSAAPRALIRYLHIALHCIIAPAEAQQTRDLWTNSQRNRDRENERIYTYTTYVYILAALIALSSPPLCFFVFFFFPILLRVVCYDRHVLDTVPRASKFCTDRSDPYRMAQLFWSYMHFLHMCTPQCPLIRYIQYTVRDV